YPGACAAKTGYALAAGPCAASAVNRGDGHKYYAVVLGSSSKPQRFVDSAALYDWAYANRSSLRAPIADEDIAGLAWGERVAFTVAWFMEGW
ncbi:MAG: D-alanyl-D-alanine carboxypeptidase, partial [Eggerthella sp.]|nr:D-alanyl-D-alanine carboxypeptidase [Eggerthella sp.]